MKQFAVQKTKDTYFAQMRETSEAVFPIILDQVSKTKEIDAGLYDQLMFFTKKRASRPLLKPYLLRLAYEVCGGKHWRDVAPACAAFELLNISSYQANSSLDSKYGVLSQDQKNSQFIASMISRELCLEAIAPLAHTFGADVVASVTDALRMSNKWMYVAQHYDLNVLTTSRLDAYLRDEARYMQDYMTRCHYGSGIVNGQCAVAGGLLARANSEQLAALKSFGESLGTGMQIVNDAADFVHPASEPAVGRDFQDPFSDVKNGRLTLGLYRLLTTVNRPEWLLRKLMRGDDFNDRDLINIASMIARTDALSQVRALAARCGRAAKNALSPFPATPVKHLLCQMASLCYSNKVFRHYSLCHRDFALNALKETEVTHAA